MCFKRPIEILLMQIHLMSAHMKAFYKFHVGQEFDARIHSIQCKLVVFEYWASKQTGYFASWFFFFSSWIMCFILTILIHLKVSHPLTEFECLVTYSMLPKTTLTTMNPLKVSTHSRLKWVEHETYDDNTWHETYRVYEGSNPEKKAASFRTLSKRGGGVQP